MHIYGATGLCLTSIIITVLKCTEKSNIVSNFSDIYNIKL